MRDLRESDAEALYGSVAASQAALKKRMSWPAGVRSAKDAEEFIGQSAARRRRVLGLFEAKTGLHVGVAALQELSPERPTAELSGWIRSDRQGQGYAAEAGQELVARAFKEMGLRRLYARIDPANRAGRKVLQKLGFKYEGCLRQEKRLNGRWVNQECWGLLQKEYGRP